MIVCLVAAIFCVNVFLAIDRHSHSVSDTLYGVFPYFACSGLDREANQLAPPSRNYELPMKIPVKNTNTPPKPTCSAAEKGGVSI